MFFKKLGRTKGNKEDNNHQGIINTAEATAAAEDAESGFAYVSIPPAQASAPPATQDDNHNNGIFANLDPANPAPMPPLNEAEQRAYKTLKRIKYVMDDAIPLPCFKDRRVGLDPIMGIIPFVGDFGSAVVSLVMVARASPVLSRYTVIRMLVNVWIDAVTGVVPVVGDVFDIGWKANERNLAIFENHMKIGAQARRDIDRRWVIIVALGFFIFCCLTTALVLALIILLILYLTGTL
jgi:hypothetical protein